MGQNSMIQLIDGSTMHIEFANGVDNTLDRVRVRLTKPGPEGFDTNVETTLVQAKAIAELIKSAAGEAV